MADVSRVLADPAGREILRLLKRGDLTADAVAEGLAMSPRSVAEHLSALMEAGLVSAHRGGPEVAYSIDTTVFQDAMAAVLELFDDRWQGGTGR